MDHTEDTATFDFEDDAEVHVEELRSPSGVTEAIDISSLLADDLYTSGSFDLSCVGSASFVQLLNALPIPTFLIDRQYCVGFVNRACSRLSGEGRSMAGIPFLNLLTRPQETDRAQELMEKTRALLEKSFGANRPRMAEAILDMGTRKMWARLHIRSIRIGLERHLLAMIEDVTQEKKQLALKRRGEEESLRAQRELENRLRVMGCELAATAHRLTREFEAHVQTRKLADDERRKTEIACGHASLATALLTPMGAFKDMNPRCRELFGYDDELPTFKDCVVGMSHECSLPLGFGEEEREPPDESAGQEPLCFTGVVMCGNGSKKQVSFKLAKLRSGDYFMTCLEPALFDEEGDPVRD